MESPPLHDYARKRNFRRTPEPRGSATAPDTRRHFVVQKHDARRLHYDFRLELDGVLKSWAVPKGPSYNPDEKRLAVHVEDHPLEYADFEGVIPAGEYGAGTVLVWDFGTWEPMGDPRRGYRQGRLHFRLHGARLQGEWALARMGGAAAGENRENWLLLKVAERTPHAELPDDTHATSVLSGRTLAQIALAPERTWSAAGACGGEERALFAGAPMPQELAPQLATLVESPPAGRGWLHEIKFDGYRTLCRIREGRVALLSRNGKDWTHRFGALARALRTLPLRNAWLDGEVAALAPDGRTSFSALQLALSEERDGDLVYFLFDLLYRDGADLRSLPLAQRKAALADLLAAAPAGSPLRFGDHLGGEGAAVYREACGLGLEGLVSKRADAPWHPDRARDWQKVKCLQRQEFVIGGFTAPRGTRSAFGALLVGFYRGGELIFAGRVGTGFDEATLHNLYGRLAPLAIPQSPFANTIPPPRAGRVAATWVRPELVAEVAYTEWTRDDVLRQPVFLGLREDKPAREVVREAPARAGVAEASAGETGPAARPEGTVPNDSFAPGTGTKAALLPQISIPRLTHPDKLYYPNEHLTKRDIADYYAAVGDWILPDLVGRPLTLLRCPDGAHLPCFYQKHATETLPPGIARVPIRESEGRGIYLVVESLAGVVGLVQMGVLEIHTWGARADNPDAPDRMIFDLDPDEGLPWGAVLDGARLLREALETLRLVPFLRATGGKGLHVVVPLVRRHTWPEVKEFTHALARAIAQSAPHAYTTNPAKPARRGKLYLDYLRNGRGATAIANFSTRAKPGAPVAVPLAWEELGTPAAAFSVLNVRERLAGLATDPWGGYRDAARVITKPMKRALGLQ